MEFLINLVKVNAKSIAVPVTAIILAVIKWIAENVGVELIVDNEALTNTIAAIIIGIVVWWVRNKQRKEPVPEFLRDRGQSGIQILYIVVILLIIACLIVWLSRNT